MNWIFWSLLSAFFAGLTAVLAKIGVTGVDSNLATAVRTTVVLLFTWSIAFSTGSNTMAGLSRLSDRAWSFLVLSGVATGLSWLCYFRALQLGEASRVAPVDKLSVVFAILFAAILLHEKLGWQQWVGGSFVVTGAVILATK
jgi:transporter family protein